MHCVHFVERVTSLFGRLVGDKSDSTLFTNVMRS